MNPQPPVQPSQRSLRHRNTCRGLAALFLCVALSAALPAAALEAGPPPHPTLAQTLAGTFIVEAKVIAIEHIPNETREPWTTARLEVTRVYCGQGVKVGERFVALALQPDAPDEPDAQGHRRPTPPPVPDLGNVGIWRIEPSKGLSWIREDDTVRFRGTSVNGDWLRGTEDSHSIIGGDLLVLFWGMLNGYPTPAQIAAQPKVADALAALSSEGDETKREALLQDQMESGGPYVAAFDAWLIRWSDGDPERGERVKRLFLDPKMPVMGRAAMDQLACVWVGREWIGSETRQKVLMQLGGAAKTPSDFAWLSAWLTCGLCDKQLTMRQCIDIVSAEFRNPGRVHGELDKAFPTLFTKFTGSPADRNAAFSFFGDLLRTTKDSRIRLLAAGGLYYINLSPFPMTLEEIGAARSLRTSARGDTETGDALDLTIAAAVASQAAVRESTAPSGK